jgi:hypothetical protein
MFMVFVQEILLRALPPLTEEREPLPSKEEGLKSAPSVPGETRSQTRFEINLPTLRSKRSHCPPKRAGRAQAST